MPRSSVAVSQHASVTAFLAAAEPWLLRSEARNSLMIGLAHNLATGRSYGSEPPLLLTLQRGSQVVGAALQTPPYPLLSTPLAPAVGRALVDWLVERGRVPASVNGESAITLRLGKHLAERCALRLCPAERMRLFELREAIEPAWPDGGMRRAGRADHEQVAAFYDAFHAEALPRERTESFPVSLIEQGKVLLWVDGAGEPVCLAVRTREHANGASIGNVYTPPQRRGRGYATALVAALSKAILAEGKRYVCLFTDLANPVSNAIYPRVGYRAIADFRLFNLEPSAVGVVAASGAP